MFANNNVYLLLFNVVFMIADLPFIKRIRDNILKVILFKVGCVLIAVIE